MTDLRTTGLTADAIEREIIRDLTAFRAGGGVVAQPRMPGFTGPTERTLTVGGHSISYRAVQTAPDQLGIGTYFLR